MRQTRREREIEREVSVVAPHGGWVSRWKRQMHDMPVGLRLPHPFLSRSGCTVTIRGDIYSVHSGRGLQRGRRGALVSVSA